MWISAGLFESVVLDDSRVAGRGPGASALKSLLTTSSCAGGDRDDFRFG